MDIFPSALLIALTLALLTFHPVFVYAACRAKRLTFEPCFNNLDCAHITGITSPVCSGRNATGQVDICPKQDVNNCICRPSIDANICEDNRDCLDEEFCAYAIRSHSKVCVGCLALTDDFLSQAFIAVQPAQTKNERCYNQGISHPPCGFSEDFCSPTMPCDDAYKCVSEVDGRFFQCDWESIRCKCLKSDANKPLFVVERKSCTADDDCDEREVCATFTTRNEQYCVSCDFARLSHDIVPQNFSQPSKCDAPGFEKRPTPISYVEGPNGLSIDRCLSDKHCIGDRRCMAFELKNGKTKLSKCSDRVDKQCFCNPEKLQGCTTGSNCTLGESCMTGSFQNFELNKKCVSNALFEVLSSRFYEVEGERARSPNGRGLNDDQCKYDWNCTSPRRCTHAVDVYGRCAGREGCRCKPLINPACTKNNDCASGENCVSAVDAPFEPYCMSQIAMRNNPYLFQINDVRLAAGVPTPIPLGFSNGLTGDPCFDTSDCVAPRMCYHRFDLPVITDRTRCDGSVRNCLCKLPQGIEHNCTLSKDCADSREACIMYKDEVPPNRRCMSALAIDANANSGIQIQVEFGARQSPLPSPSKEVSYAESSTSADTSVPVDPEESPSAPPCIDVKLLRAFKVEDLVYSQHVRASVLCDENGSCATSGHMVAFRNSAMAMKSYCAWHTKCTKRVAWVNSPRMKAGLRVDSATLGLKMTVYSARYESWAEERMLRQLIQLGL